MAGTIPVYESKRGVDIQLVPKMSNEGAMRTARAGAQLTGAADNAIETMQKVTDFRETNEAAAYAFESLQRIKAKADQDVGFDSKPYEKEIQQIGNDAQRTISSGSARNAFISDFSRQASAVTWGIKNKFRDKELDVAKSTLVLRHEQIVSNYGDMNAAQKEESVANFNLMLKSSVKQGIMLQPDADLQWKKFQDDVHESVAKTDIANDSAITTEGSSVIGEIEKGAKGKYAELNSIQREDLLKKARVKINDNKQFAVEAQVDSRLDILKQFADGQIDALDTDGVVKNITLSDPKLGEAIRAGTDSLFIPKTDDEAFSQMVNDVVVKSSTKEQVASFLMNVLNSDDNKRISRERLAILINASVERAKGLKASEDHPEKTESPASVERNAFIKSILGRPRAFSAGNTLVHFFEAVKAGKSSRAAHDEAVKAETARVNPLSTKYKVGDIVTNPKTQESAEIIGFNGVGTPILKRKSSGK